MWVVFLLVLVISGWGCAVYHFNRSTEYLMAYQQMLRHLIKIGRLPPEEEA